MWKYLTNSTLKREFALFLSLWLIGAATYLLAAKTVSDMQFRILDLFTWPILGGAFGVFGMDWISKQTHIAGPPTNTETVVKTEVNDNATVQTVSSENKE